MPNVLRGPILQVAKITYVTTAFCRMLAKEPPLDTVPQPVITLSLYSTLL